MSGNGGVWVTVNGTHIFIKDNETFDEAVERLKSYNKSHPKKEENSKYKSENNEITDKEKSAIEYWVKGNNGWGYNDIRQMANGVNLEDVPRIKTLKEKGFSDNDSLYKETKSNLSEYNKNFESAIKKMPDAKGEIVRFSESMRVPSVGEEVSLLKYTSFTNKMTYEMFDNFGHGNYTVVYAIKNPKDFADITKYSIENEVISRNNHKYKVVKVEESNFGGSPVPDDKKWLYGDQKYIGGKNYKRVTLERV